MKSITTILPLLLAAGLTLAVSSCAGVPGMSVMLDEDGNTVVTAVVKPEGSGK